MSRLIGKDRSNGHWAVDSGVKPIFRELVSSHVVASNPSQAGSDAHPAHPPPGIPAMKVRFVLAACAVLVAAPNAVATMLQLSSVGARSSAGERRAPSSDIARIERNAAYYE